MADLVIKSLNKSFGANDVFKDFNLTIKSGSVLAILGASGVGKSTLLNILSGEITDYTGEINGKPEKISYVFSKDRLVPTLTVFQNVRLVLGEEKSKELDDLCRDILFKSGLDRDVDLYPHQLSTGMAKRVNLARAFIYGGELMLLDEPFANLDIVTKLDAIDLFLKLQKERKQTAILVTHDVAEAISVADEIAIIKWQEPAITFSKSDYDSQTLIEKIKVTLKGTDKVEIV